MRLGSKLSRPTEAKVWSTGGGYRFSAFVLRVLTTNHVRDNTNLEAKYREGGVSNINSLLYQYMLDLTGIRPAIAASSEHPRMCLVGHFVTKHP